jgi:hypothetical protein
MVVVLQDGPEDDSHVGALRTQVLSNDMETMLVTLDTIRSEHPYGFDCRDSKNRTALHASCEPHVSPDIVLVLLQPENQTYGGRPNDQTLKLETALISCVRCNSKYTSRMKAQDAVIKARMLLKFGANVSLTGYLGMSPLGHVGSVEMATVLLEHWNGADINSLDYAGRTVLSKSITAGDVALCELLVKHGADISITLPYTSNIHNAISSDTKQFQPNDNRMHIDMLQFVLENGVDITLRDCQNRSALELADSLRNKYAVRLIKLITKELPIETSKWTHEKVDAIRQSVKMSQHKKVAADSGMCSIPPEMVKVLIQHINASHPTNMVSAAMSSIKEMHNGRLPIQDSDIREQRMAEITKSFAQHKIDRDITEE